MIDFIFESPFTLYTLIFIFKISALIRALINMMMAGPRNKPTTPTNLKAIYILARADSAPIPMASPNILGSIMRLKANRMPYRIRSPIATK